MSKFFGSVVDEEEVYERSIRFARIALFIVAASALYIAIAAWTRLENLSDYLVNSPSSSTVRFIIIMTFVEGFIYGLLFFWAKIKPFWACLIAFVLYATGLTLAFIKAPESFHFNIPIRLLVLLALIKGVHSGWKYRNYQRLKEKGEIV